MADDDVDEPKCAHDWVSDGADGTWTGYVQYVKCCKCGALDSWEVRDV